MKYSFKRKPKPYQVAALKKALDIGNIAIWFDPGLGKTKVAIDLVAIDHLKEAITKVLVVCPLSAIGVWEDEFPLDFPDDIKINITPIVGDDRTSKIVPVLRSSALNVMICNYDLFGYENKKPNHALRLVKAWKPQVVIIDEAHSIKNKETQRTRSVYELTREAKRVIELTGTPLPRNLLDVFGQYYVLDEEIFGTDYRSFFYRYAIPHKDFKTKVIKWKRMDEFEHKLHQRSFRVKDSEFRGMSPIRFQDVPVYLTDKTKAIYKGMAEELIVQLESGDVIDAKMKAVSLMKLQQITGGFIQKQDVYLNDKEEVVKQNVYFPLGGEKLEVLSDLIDRYVDEHKIIIGCRFLWEIAQIEMMLKRKKVDFRTIKGGVSGEDRTEAKRAFQSDKTTRVIIFQVSAATAMTLTAADIGILYSCTSKWDDYWQWLKRIHRIDQKKPVTIFKLIAKGTVDRDIYHKLQDKENFTIEHIEKSKYRNLFDFKEA